MRRVPQVHHVALQRLAGHHALLHQGADLIQLAPGDDARLHAIEQGFGVVERRIEHQGMARCAVRGRGHAQLEHEAIARSRWKLEGLFALETIAVGEHRHVREAELAVERGHAALRHRAQQQRLHLRARPVDLVEEEGGERVSVAQQGAGLDARLARVVHVRVIDQVARHEVHRAFDAFELAAHRARERAQHRRLADADVAFEQHVAAREQRHVDHAQRVLLADHGACDVLLDAQGPPPPVLQQFVSAAHRER